MSGALWNLVGKRVLNEHARNRFGMEDPYFEEVPASRLGRTMGKKTVKRRKAIPPGLSEHDAHVLTQVKRRAYRLDYCLFNLCGIRFGWGSVIGLIPFAGDAGDAALALMVVKTCEGIEGGLPARLRTMMMMNVIIDFVIGLVPFIGDLADAVYKCNTRNAVLLEKHLREKGAKRLAKDNRRVEQQGDRDRHGRSHRTIDHSLPDEFDRQEEGVVENPPPGYDTEMQETNQPARPKPSKKKGRSGWFGGASHPQEDLERGGA